MNYLSDFIERNSRFEKRAERVILEDNVTSVDTEE
jgi:hypothetical protein